MELKIITLNCWGLAFVARNRRSRIQAIAEVLATSNYDVVCLQEVWIDSDFKLIKDKASGNLPYSHYFYSGVTGSGVCVLSRFPMEEAFFHQWPVNGYIHKLHHGDWFGGKGVGLCRLRINGCIVNIYSAHLHAEYNRNCDEYQAHRVLQAFDTAQFIQLTSGDADLVVLAGDLNTEPGDLAYRLILNLPGFVDAFTEAGESAQDIASTNESLSNSYTPANSIRDSVPGKRIDYVMYRPGAKIKAALKSYELPLPDKVPQCSYSYSDHEAVAVRLVIEKLDSVERPRDDDTISDRSNKEALLEESIAICEDALCSLGNHKLMYWMFTFVLFVFLVLTLETKAPFGFQIGYHVLKVVISLLMFFAFVMATIWNKMEKHGILAGKLSMEVSLRKLLNTKEGL